MVACCHVGAVFAVLGLRLYRDYTRLVSGSGIITQGLGFGGDIIPIMTNQVDKSIQKWN